MRNKQKSTLAIDRGSKYVWLAYQQHGSTVVFPVGYILNDKMMYFSLSEIIFKHNVDTIVIGMPARQKDIQAKIQAFIKSLETIIDKEKVTIQTVDEDYTSVQAWEIVSNFKKNVAEDTVSAMLILERRNALQD